MKKVFKPRKPDWTANQWSNFNRINLILDYCLAHGYFCAWATLTSSPETKDMKRAFHELRERFKREFGFSIDYIKTSTSEGACGVYHVFFVTEKRMPKCQQWLSETWEKLTGANRVYINEIKGPGAAGKCARYQVNQYQIGQGSKYLRTDYSKFKFLPFAVNTLLKDCRKYLRSECYRWTPWHVGHLQYIKMAHDLLHTGKHVTGTGHILVCNEFTDYKIQCVSSPFA